MISGQDPRRAIGTEPAAVQTLFASHVSATTCDILEHRRVLISRDHLLSSIAPESSKVHRPHLPHGGALDIRCPVQALGTRRRYLCCPPAHAALLILSSHIFLKTRCQNLLLCSESCDNCVKAIQSAKFIKF